MWVVENLPLVAKNKNPFSHSHLELVYSFCGLCPWSGGGRLLVLRILLMVRRGFLGGLTYASRRGDFAGNADLPDFGIKPAQVVSHSQCLHACWGYSVVRILPTSSHDTCHIQPILLSYLVSDTRIPYCLVYRSSNQPDVSGMMWLVVH
jgi:hypothetical protein